MQKMLFFKNKQKSKFKYLDNDKDKLILFTNNLVKSICLNKNQHMNIIESANSQLLGFFSFQNF